MSDHPADEYLAYAQEHGIPADFSLCIHAWRNGVSKERLAGFAAECEAIAAAVCLLPNPPWSESAKKVSGDQRLCTAAMVASFASWSASKDMCVLPIEAYRSPGGELCFLPTSEEEYDDFRARAKAPVPPQPFTEAHAALVSEFNAGATEAGLVVQEGLVHYAIAQGMDREAFVRWAAALREAAHPRVGGTP